MQPPRPDIVNHAVPFRDPSLPTITVAGFAATVAQILLLRELLVLFYGNEMSTALALAGWLLWTALGSGVSARLTSTLSAGEGRLAGLLTLQALGLPAVVLVVRGARWLYGIPLGELATIGTMTLVCLTAPVLFCPIAGGLFASCWAYRRQRDAERSTTRALAIYLGEALGAAAGGLVFYFIMVRLTTALNAALAVATVLLAVSGWLLWGLRRRRRDIAARVIWGCAVVVVLVLAAGGGILDQRSRRWQWGESLVAARDTPFHNIAVLQQDEQVTLFTNGLWLMTQPDPATAEAAVHTALLQHAHPRQVLLLGGGLADLVGEVLKHPSIDRVDYVEQDPELISFSEAFLSARTRQSLRESRVHIQLADAGTFLRRSEESYDAVLMHVGDPINAQMNRFYTEEFFRQVSRHLRTGGIFTFSVPGGGDMVGPAHAQLLGSLDRTLGRVFPRVRVLPGERARFFAARDRQSLVLDPAVLALRSRERSLQLVHLREDTLQDLMSPLKLDYLEAILASLGDSPVNRQFAPICYFYGMMLWAAQWHPSLSPLIEAAARVRTFRLYLFVAVIGVVLTLYFWLGRPRYRAAVQISVLVQGAAGMVLQIVLILSFQILAGFAYRLLALIIAFFMAGLSVGTLGITSMRRTWPRESRSISWLAALQVGVTLFPLVVLALLSPICEDLREGLSPAAAAWLFTAVSFFAGVLGGSHFSAAVLASTVTGARLEPTGGYLYALDLTGAATGALVAGLFVLPLYGVSSTLVLLSLLSLFCLGAILRRPALPL